MAAMPSLTFHPRRRAQGHAAETTLPVQLIISRVEAAIYEDGTVLSRAHSARGARVLSGMFGWDKQSDVFAFSSGQHSGTSPSELIPLPILPFSHSHASACGGTMNKKDYVASAANCPFAKRTMRA